MFLCMDLFIQLIEMAGSTWTQPAGCGNVLAEAPEICTTNWTTERLDFRPCIL